MVAGSYGPTVARPHLLKPRKGASEETEWLDTCRQTRFSETGSGVLVSLDGKVMTAAHVVHAMDEIKVEFLRGETVAARVVSSEPGADLSLVQLERVPSGSKVAPMADSSTVQVGDDLIIVGAPYGLATR